MDRRRPFSFSDALQTGPLMARAFSVPDGIPAAMRAALDRIERAEKQSSKTRDAKASPRPQA